MKLYAHPFSSYCQKVLIALYENATPFELRLLAPADQRAAAEHRDPYGVDQARSLLDVAYRWLEGALAGRQWANGNAFSLADCAAAPALFYADWAHPIGEACANVRAYRRRLLARPSFARAVN